MLAGSPLAGLINTGLSAEDQGDADALLVGLAGGFGADQALGQNFTSAKGGAPLGVATNLGLAGLLEGEQRGAQRESIFDQLALLQGMSPQAASADALTAAGTGLLDPGARMERRNQLEDRLRLNANQTANSAFNRLQDLGMAGQGNLQAPALASASSQIGSDLANRLTQLDQLMAEEARADIGAAATPTALGGELFSQFRVNPMLQIASALAGPRNIERPAFTDQMERLGQLATGTALQSRTPSTAQQLLPLLGGLASGGGSFLGGLASAGKIF